MALIRQTIPNLVQGVSQQPDAMRLEGQCSEQVNAFSDPTNGLRKRPRTDFVRKKSITILDTDVNHFIKRQSSERYNIVTSGDKLRVFDLETGLEAKIEKTAEDGNNTTYTDGLPIASGDYLESVDYRKDLKFLTVGDSTYIANKNIYVDKKSDATEGGGEEDAEYTTPVQEEEALVYVKQGASDTAYSIQIDHNDDTSAGTPVQALVTFHFKGVYKAGRQGTQLLQHFVLDKNGVGTITQGGAGYIEGQEFIIRVDHKNGPTYHKASNGGVEYRTHPVTGALTYIRIKDNVSYRRWGSSTSAPTVQQNSTGITAPNNPNFTLSQIDTFYKSDDEADVATRGNTTPYASNLTKTATVLIANKLADLMISTHSTVAAAEASSVLFTVERRGNMIKIKQASTAPATFKWSIKSEDGLANNGLQVIYKQVGSITDLPLQCYNDFKVKVSGDATTGTDDYYVIFKTLNGETFGDGVWEETIGFNESLSLDAETLPHILSLQTLGTSDSDPATFLFSPIEVEKRLVGDVVSNPFPSFLGLQIENMFFFQNRLGFLSEDKVNMTEYGLGKVVNNRIFYNFGRTTVQTFLQTDPIDITIATDRVTNLKSSAIFQDKLILFSENTQFSLESGGEVLGPTTVSVAPVTEFNASPEVNPIVVGDAVYFPIDKNDSLELREYRVNKTTESFESFATTQQIPTYIPSGVRDIAFTTTQNMIALTSGTDLKTLYIYKFLLDNNGQKIQSSWSKFTFLYDIHGIDFDKDVLTILFKYDGGGTTNDCLLESTMNFDMSISEDTGVSNHATLGYAGLFDLSFNVTFDGSGTNTTATIPFPTQHLGLSTTDWDMSDEDYSSLSYYNSSNNTIVFSHFNNSSVTVRVGLKYSMSYTFSEFIIKQKSEKFQTAINISHRLKNISVYYANTKGPDNQGKFDLILAPTRTLQIDDANGEHKTTFGTEEYQNYDPVDGFFTVPLFINAEDTVIRLEQPYKYPANFQNVNIESIVRDRARAY